MSVQRGLVVIGALAAVGVLSPSAALAAPALKIESPRSGSVIGDPTPRIKGTTDDTYDLASEAFDQVTVTVRDSRGVVQELAATAPPFVESWSAVAARLPDGSYTAQASQTNMLGETGRSDAIAFTVDTTAPAVTMNAPSTASSGEPVQVGGSAGTAPGDQPAIAIALFAGTTIGSQAPIETLVVQASNGAWSASFGGLAAGTYTARASQADEAGNSGVSGSATLTVVTPPAPPPPSASFSWFPQAPAVGEVVSLASSSTDPASPLVSFAWALAPTGAFTAGTPVLNTLFTAPGPHVVRLSVTDAAGRSSVATETIPVSQRHIALMQPFPVVRMAGALTRGGALIKLLTVQAPLAARITISCSGAGCRTKSESRLAAASSKGKPKTGVVTLGFPRFQRSLRAGVVLRIRISKEGQIGKYTSFTIRSGRPPKRIDACLQPTSAKPIPCAAV